VIALPLQVAENENRRWPSRPRCDKHYEAGPPARIGENPHAPITRRPGHPTPHASSTPRHPEEVSTSWVPTVAIPAGSPAAASTPTGTPRRRGAVAVLLTLRRGRRCQNARMPAQSLLKRETNYGVWKESRPLRPSRFYFGTEGKPYRYFRKSWWLEAQERSEREPVKLHEHNGRTWWRFKGDIVTEASNLSAGDVQALALQLRREKDKTLERAHAQMKGEAQSNPSRERIPQSVRNEVWQRDQGRVSTAAPESDSSTTTSSPSVREALTPLATSSFAAKPVTEPSRTTSSSSSQSLSRRNPLPSVTRLERRWPSWLADHWTGW
jgi:hypothetical protein